MANTNDLLGSLVQQLGGNGIAEIARTAGVSGGDECDADDDADGVSDVFENCMGTSPKDDAADSTSDNANPFDFDNNTVQGVVLSNDANGVVIADAVRLDRVME